MKRSEINQLILSADDFLRERGFYLPPFAYWTPEHWRSKGPEAREIVEHRLGWDLTDFGSGNFAKYGLTLFTIRNGHPLKPEAGKTYCEKILIVGDAQITPLHFHWLKTEDIINRGGGTLIVQLHNALPDETPDETSAVTVAIDGVTRTVRAGGLLTLEPGESITLPPYCYHAFWGEERVLVGEVSKVNNDATDNRFYPPVGRFPTIEEDEPPAYLLCTDYAQFYSGGA